MALVASSPSIGLPFSPNTFEWPRLNELSSYNNDGSHDISLFANGNTNYENPSTKFRKPEIPRGSHEIKNDVTKLTTDVCGHFSCKHSGNCDFSNVTDSCGPSNIRVNINLNHLSANIDIESSKTSSEPELPELTERLVDSSDIPEDVSQTNFPDTCDDDKLVTERESTNCKNTETSGSICVKKKKRLKKLRQKSIRKWKPVDYAELGFHISNLNRLPNEAAMFDCDNDDKNLSSVDEAAHSQVFESVMENDSKNCDNADIAQNDADSIAFFQSLGVDVLNFEYDDEDYDLLHWDGVCFPKETRASQPPQNTNHVYIPKGKSKVKSKLADNVQTVTSSPIKLKSHEPNNSDNISSSSPVKLKSQLRNDSDIINNISPSSTVLSRIKKCDRYKLFELECSSAKRIYIRRDRHRRLEKPHKAVKSKNCRSIFRNIGRKRMYMHHRLVKMQNLNLDFRGSIKSYGVPPMTKTKVSSDAAKEIFRADRKDTATPHQPPPAPVQNLNHALHETNCVGHLEMDLASFLISLQHREMTPEDYDMLLRLDDTVKPKTVSESVLEKLRTETIGPNGPEQGSSEWEPMCTICMEPYIEGQERKFLPCNHDFHTPCIDRWLKDSSLNCPLDGLPIESS